MQKLRVGENISPPGADPAWRRSNERQRSRGRGRKAGPREQGLAMPSDVSKRDMRHHEKGRVRGGFLLVLSGVSPVLSVELERPGSFCCTR